jgi:exopolyphosphatase/guanosine-5'-triphosphate,3'-diphosphate pyrophosphatase
VIVAGIDIGSNTVRLLIAEVEARIGTPSRPAIRTIHEDRRITRLGEGVGDSNRLSPSAVDRTLSALNQFKAAIDQWKPAAVVCTATSAVRESKNGREFVRRVLVETGLSVEVIAGEEEARRTLLGVERALDETPESLLVIDIGGGSTELIYRGRKGPIRAVSTPLGVVKLTESFLKSDPPIPADAAKMTAAIESALRTVWPVSGSSNPAVIGTAGTVTTLAAMELGMKRYDPERVQNYRMTRRQVQTWYERLLGLALTERRKLAGLEKGREDLIVAGTAILLVALNLANADEWIVSDAGLREGLLVNWFLVHDRAGKTESSGGP